MITREGSEKHPPNLPVASDLATREVPHERFPLLPLTFYLLPALLILHVQRHRMQLDELRRRHHRVPLPGIVIVEDLEA
jgi:hypothetical protein